MERPAYQTAKQFAQKDDCRAPISAARCFTIFLLYPSLGRLPCNDTRAATGDSPASRSRIMMKPFRIVLANIALCFLVCVSPRPSSAAPAEEKSSPPGKDVRAA